MNNSLPYRQAARFIDEAVEVIFRQPPALEKKPPCPDAFIWRGEHFEIAHLLAEWFDATRRGRMARNMRPSHAERAAVQGSWGNGRYTFRVETTGGRIFELYYDRASVDANRRKGSWVLLLERPRTNSTGAAPDDHSAG